MSKKSTELDVGDKVEIQYVMYEDSCPEWVSYGHGWIKEVLFRKSYHAKYTVEREDGSVKDLDSGNLVYICSY